jgi:hypothetical protein
MEMITSRQPFGKRLDQKPTQPNLLGKGWTKNQLNPTFWEKVGPKTLYIFVGKFCTVFAVLFF